MQYTQRSGEIVTFTKGERTQSAGEILTFTKGKRTQQGSRTLTTHILVHNTHFGSFLS